MGYVSAADYERILAIVAEASLGSTEEPLSGHVLEMIRALVACDVAAYFEGPPEDRAGRRIWTTEIAIPWRASEIEATIMFRSQLPISPSPRTMDRAIRVSDVMSQRHYRGLDLYQLAGRHHDIEFAMDHWMNGLRGQVRGLTFDNGSRDFSDHRRDAVEVLGRHLKVVLGQHDRIRGAARNTGPSAVLTAREAEIVTLLAVGHTNRQIASVLSISPHTVRKHLENTYATLGIHTRAEAVVWVYRERDRLEALAPRPAGSPGMRPPQPLTD